MKTALSLIIGAALFCLVMIFYLATAHADTTKNCRTAEQVRRDVGAAFKNISMTDLSGDELKQFLLGFNAITPVSNVTAGHAMAIGIICKSDIDIVFFNDLGCLFSQSYISKVQFEKIFEGI